MTELTPLARKLFKVRPDIFAATYEPTEGVTL